MSEARIADGGYSFESGVDAGRIPTVRSAVNPNGLARGMVAWLTNGTVRGGGITQRPAWTKLCTVVAAAGAAYNSGYLYEPQLGNPYLMLSIGGTIYQVRVDTDNSVLNISHNNGNLVNPSTPQGYMTQGEQFLVIQAGDWAVNNAGTLPMFWDGATLRRSLGLGGGTKELPSALAMAYYQGRLWYSNGRKYTAGDIVDGPSGTAPYQLSDSILKVTENPLAIGGDGFTVPSGAGPITALNYTAQLDSSLGQGNLYIFTRRQIYALVVPVTRTAWIAATGSNQPQQLVAQTKWGTPSERSVVRINGDLFYASMEPAVRSLTVATRYFQQWGNTPISRNIQRALDFTNPILMGLSTGINFQNRLLMGLLPKQGASGTVYQGIGILNFDSISTLQEQLPPAWEGVWEGLDVLQLFEGDFGGQERAFAVVSSRVDSSIQVWELSTANKFENGDNRVQWQIEFPAYTWGKEFDLKELDGGEIWLDRLYGTVQLNVEYRQDSSPCWQPWLNTQFCAARNTCENITQPICYPVQPYCEGEKFPITLPKPDGQNCNQFDRRPSNLGYQFQVRLTIKGFCRIRGLILFALPKQRQEFQGLTSSCSPSQPSPQKNFKNAAQTCTVNCPDGLPFSFTCPAGVFSSTTQGDADAQANAYACQQAQLRMVCLSALDNPTATPSVEYTGTITATGLELETGSQENNWQLAAGSQLPPGLQFNGGMLQSNQVTITGIPTALGTFVFGVVITDPQGNTMTKQYSISVGCPTFTAVTVNTNGYYTLGGNSFPPFTEGYTADAIVPNGTQATLALTFQSAQPVTWNANWFLFGIPANTNFTLFINGVPTTINSGPGPFANINYNFSFTTSNCVPTTIEFTYTPNTDSNGSGILWQPPS